MPRISIVLVILAILVGGIYFWQKNTISQTPKLSDQAVSEANYTNDKWKFSLDIPEGYLVRGEEDILYVVKKPTPDNETPIPEMKIKIEQGSQTTVETTQDLTMVSQEQVSINNIDGHKTVVSYKDYPEGSQCPIYRLHKNGTVYEFSLYECLESAIFETVVQSFKII